MAAPAFAHSSGPRTARIALVGEAWGEQEDLFGKPFVGYSGQELSRMLSEAGIDRKECFLTNVFALRPPDNKLEAILVDKSQAAPGWVALGNGKWLPQALLPELERLRTELVAVKPNVIVALGATASWALLSSPKIATVRGVASISTLVPPQKVLPTFHPAAILRQWPLRAVAVADLIKAKRESLFPEIIRPTRQVTINPTLSDIEEFFSDACSAPVLAVDIETGARQIKCVGFAISRSRALVIPFVDLRSNGGNYWPDIRDEVAAWHWVKRLLALPAAKLFQNGLYDLQYLCRMGFRPKNCIEDTMLLHHALYPELQKGLGFLGSIYTNEASWKLMRKTAAEGEKREE